MAEITTALGRSSSTYERVREELRQRCRQEAGTALPSLRQLSLELDANHLTITRALRDLESEGLLEVVPRKGTFIRANGLQTGNTNIELVTLNSQRPSLLDISAHLLRGMEAAAGTGIVHGTTIAVPPVPDVKSFLQTLQERRVGAVLFLGVSYLKYPDSLAEAAFIHEMSQQMPVIAVGSPHAIVDMDSVYGDPRTAMQTYLEACRVQGATRYGYLGNYPQRATGHERFEVFRNFLLANAIRWDERYVLGYNSAPLIRDEIREFFEMESLPEVIITADIRYASATVIEAQRQGLKPGRDIHILTFSSNEAEIQHLLPDISVILIDEAEVGRRAYELAVERLANRQQERRTLTVRVPSRLLNNVAG
jgi:DNA-binding LacI/PurR family transcriptional regulator